MGRVGQPTAGEGSSFPPAAPRLLGLPPGPGQCQVSSGDRRLGPSLTRTRFWLSLSVGPSPQLQPLELGQGGGQAALPCTHLSLPVGLNVQPHIS